MQLKPQEQGQTRVGRGDVRIEASILTDAALYRIGNPYPLSENLLYILCIISLYTVTLLILYETILEVV